MVIKRANSKLTVVVTPVTDKSNGKSRIGVKFELGKDVYEIEHPTPWAQVRDVCLQVYGTIAALVHSHESGVKASDLSGPVGIIGALAVQWSTDYRLALSFLVMLNINLAILNMLPMPVLDGGHILMAMIERIRRRPMEVRIVEYTTTAFAVLLISFMAYVTMYDIKRLSLFRMLFNRDSQIEQPATPASPPTDVGNKQDRLEIQPDQKPDSAPAANPSSR
jgi:regulator of sigma E protease